MANLQTNGVQVRTRGPKAVTRVLDLLALLANRPDGMTLSELSAELSVAKSTFLDTLRGLCDLQYLSLADGRYRLGSASYHFASKIVTNWSAPDMVRAAVKRLAEASKESVGFAIADWETGQAIYIVAVNSRQPVRYAMQAGLKAPLYASAAGRVLLAYGSDARIRDYLGKATLRSLTQNTTTDPEGIVQNLRVIRDQGYCASFGEMLRDTAAIAVPIFDPAGKVLGAMMLAAPLDRMKAGFERLLALTLEAGRTASAG